MISARVVSVAVDPHATEDFIARLNLGLSDVAEAVLSRSQELVAVDEGMLKKSGHLEHEELNHSIVYDAPHAQDSEYGTDPHMPPFENIRGWVYRKRGDLGVKLGDVDNVAKAIQYKIADYGTDPQPFLRPAYDEVIVQAAGIIRAHFNE